MLWSWDFHKTPIRIQLETTSQFRSLKLSVQNKYWEECGVTGASSKAPTGRPQPSLHITLRLN